MTKACLNRASDRSSYISCNKDGARTPIVFLHGNGFSKEVFERQFESAALKDHPLLAIDMAGHGAAQNASDPKSTYSFQGLATDVSSRLAGRFDQPYLVAGWSLGGHVAMEMLDNDDVCGVVAFGAPPAPQGPVGILRAFHINRLLLLAGKSKFTASDADYFENAALGEFASGAYREPIMQTDPEFRPLLSRGMLTGSGTSQRERVLNTDTPICILNGEHDPLVRSQYLDGFTAPTLYSGKSLTLDDCGHAPFLQSQNIFETVLTDFATGIETSNHKALPQKSDHSAVR